MWTIDSYEYETSDSNKLSNNELYETRARTQIFVTINTTLL